MSSETKAMHQKKLFPCEKPLVTPPFFDELKGVVDCAFHPALMGPRGTGKTTAIKALASLKGKHLHVIPVHADLTTEELRGEPCLRDGNSAFQRSPVVVAAERGDWVLFDEVNQGRPGVTAWLNNVLDEDGVVSIPATGEQIPVAKGFLAFFCFNAGYQGTRDLNQALVDRLRVIYCPYWSPSKEIEVLRHRLPRMTLRDLERMVKVANSIREARRKGAIDFDFSLRTLVQWGADADHRSQDLLESFKAVVMPKVGDPQEYGPQHEALLELAKLAIQ
jgi:MoxR-like ATPase